jgi:ribonuclease P protein component
LGGLFFFVKLNQQQQRYQLGKSKRLKSRKAIDLLFKDGKSFNLFPFRIIYQFSPVDTISKTENLQAGFSATKRNFKKAVHRNRIKRLMREAYRLQKNQLEQLLLQNKKLVIFILYTGKELPAHDFLHEKMHLIIQKLQRLTNEKPLANT